MKTDRIMLAIAYVLLVAVVAFTSWQIQQVYTTMVTLGDRVHHSLCTAQADRLQMLGVETEVLVAQGAITRDKQVTIVETADAYFNAECPGFTR